MANTLIMRRLVFSMLALISADCIARTNEVLDWNPGSFALVGKQTTGWKGIRGDETFRLIYVKQGETPERWTEKTEVTELPIAITLGGKVSWNPNSVMSDEKARLQKKGCSTNMWMTLQENQTSLLYEWQNINCPGYVHQHEVGRIIMGKWYLWMLSYGIRDKVLSAEERAELIQRLLTARVAVS